MRSQFHNVFSNLIFKDSSDPRPPSSILNKKIRSSGKVYRKCYTVAAPGRAFPCCCGLADGGVVDRPQELETSFVTVALVAGQWSVQSPQGLGVPPFPPRPSSGHRNHGAPCEVARDNMLVISDAIFLFWNDSTST